MTVVAWKDGVMAADTSAWQQDVMVSTGAQKIHRLKDGSLFAACGPSDRIAEHIRWANDGGEKPADVADDSFLGLRAYPDGTLWLIGRNHDPFERLFEFAAIGAHTEFLYGAMAAGASADEAIWLAIQRCAFAGGHVRVERLEISTVSE